MGTALTVICDSGFITTAASPPDVRRGLRPADSMLIDFRAMPLVRASPTKTTGKARTEGAALYQNQSQRRG
jgi:hypothetical protein